MSTQMLNTKEKLHKRWIIFLSVFIPMAVALLFKVKIEGFDFSFLPPIYAGINGLTFFLLLLAVYYIKNGSRKKHENIMKTCLGLSSLFLLMYIAYHMTSDPTPYGGSGWVKNMYYFILISHIVLSVVIIPLVLITYSKAFLQHFELHKKWAKIAFPLWLYVTFTGVLVYLMISPYYE